MSLSEEAPVTALVQEFAASWNAHDMTAFGALFAPDADFVNVVGMRWRGRAAIQAAHEASHSSMFRSSHLAIHNTDIMLLGPSVAVSRSEWTLVGHTTPDGQALPERRGYLTHVLQKQGDRWLIAVSQNTDIVALP
jgi:uncharacterized protein (TIGR02246 family)